LDTLVILDLRDYDKTSMESFSSLKKQHRTFTDMRSVTVAARWSCCA
jgi:hypothetical protein